MIIITLEQLKKIEVILSRLKNRNDVREFEVMYNPMMKDIFIVRFKTFYTSEDGAIAIEIKYLGVNKFGQESTAQDMFGENIYAVLRDYTKINLSNPSIQVV